MGEVQGGASANTKYRLLATVGQMGANTASTSVDYTLCTGFQCTLSYNYPLDLPIVLR